MDGAGVHREAADDGAHGLAGILRADWALALWILAVGGAAVLALVRPLLPVTRIFVAAGLDWWAGEPVYTTGSGILPPPAAIVLFSPFAALPPVAADQFWRLLSAAVFMLGVYRAARLLRPDESGRVAQWVLVLTAPAAGLDLLYGRWELMVLGVLLHATVDLALRREARGGLLLALATALNPAALAPALLFGIACRRILPWLLLGLAAALLGPFLHAHPSYVAGQYAAWFATLPQTTGGYDLAAGLHRLGVVPAYALVSTVRVIAALAALAAAVQAYRRLDRPSAAFVVLMLGVLWTLLFNPATTEAAYVALAALAALSAFAEHARRPAAALPVLLGAVALALGIHLFGDWIQRPTQGWLRQALALGVLGYAVALITSGRPLADPPPEPVHINVWVPGRVAVVLCVLVAPAFGIYRLITAASLRGRLSNFDTTDFLILVVSLNVLAFALVTAAGPVLAWMRGRRT